MTGSYPQDGLEKHPWLYRENDALVLEIRVQPRAGRNEVADAQGERLKVRIAAVPVDGKANSEIITFFAKAFRVPKSHLALLAGERGRDKRIRVRHPRALPSWITGS